MKGLFFNKPLEWSIEVQGESWYQGSTLQGKLTVKNHGTEAMDLSDSGVGLAFADIKKIHARSENALKLEQRLVFSDKASILAISLELGGSSLNSTPDLEALYSLSLKRKKVSISPMNLLNNSLGSIFNCK